MNVFEIDGYKTIIQKVLLWKRERLGSRFTYEKLANACGVQKAFLSRVFRSTSHLSADQLFLACDFLAFHPIERTYTLEWHAHDLAKLAALRNDISQRIDRIRENQLRTQVRVPSAITQPETSALLIYFLDPDYQLVHSALAISRLSNNLHELRQRLRLTEKKLYTIIDYLRQNGLIREGLRGYEVIERQVYLPPDSPVFPSYRDAQRLRGIERLRSRPEAGDYSLSVIFSATESVRRRMLDEFLEYLKRVHHLVDAAHDEEVFQLSFDLFSW